MVQRFVLRYVGQGEMPAESIEQIRRVPGVNIVATTSNMVLAEGNESGLLQLVDRLQSWVISPESFHGHGDPRSGLRAKGQP